MPDEPSNEDEEVDISKEEKDILCNNKYESGDTIQNEINHQVDEYEEVSLSLSDDKASIKVDELKTKMSDMLTCGNNDLNFTDFESVNQFACLYEESAVIKFEVKKDDIDNFPGMFIIGKTNLFKRRRSRKHVHPNYELNSSSKRQHNRKKAQNNLKSFETENRFYLLTDATDDNISDIIKKVDILNKRKNELKRCRTCNFKKRHCAKHWSLSVHFVRRLGISHNPNVANREGKCRKRKVAK